MNFFTKTPDLKKKKVFFFFGWWGGGGLGVLGGMVDGWSDE